MASNKDILDAQRFNRARLVTAFTSGLPDGRELEPRSNYTPLIIGVVLTVVIVLVSLVLNKMSPKLPDKWQNDFLIVIKDTGARYYTIDGVMHPVTNITSAKLLTPAGQFQVKEVGASVVAGIPRGGQVGLISAPDDVPPGSALIKDAWTVCAVTDAVTDTWIGLTPEGLATANMALVSNQATTYVVTGGMYYALTSTTATVAALDLVNTPVHPVRADWLNLLTEGGALGPLNINGAGLPTNGLPGALANAVVGSLVDVRQDDGTMRHYVVATPTQLVELGDVAYRLYLIGTGADTGTVGNPIQAIVGDVAPLVAPNTGAIPLDWPQTLGQSVPGDQLPCLQRPMTGSDQRVRVGQIPAAGVASSAPAKVSVRGGGGVLMTVSNGGTLGAMRLIDDAGFSYGIGDPGDTLQRLGYSAADVITVPQPWAALVPPRSADAPVLSNATAKATVT